MDKLPPELLHRIFIQLDFEQRLACTLVCRSWWSVLDRYSLFYSFVLKKDKDQFTRLVNMFKQSPDRAAQVEELDIELKDSYKFNRRKLLNIFPNTRVLNVEKYFASDGFMFRHYKSHINNSHSKAKLEHLSDFYQCELACQVISSNLGVRLKTLCLNTGSIPNTPALVSQLKDLPQLTKLYLEGSSVTLHDLETIHKNIPSIQDFTLQHVNIKAGSMPSDILPATAITKFRFRTHRVANPEVHSQFYQYLTKKYINMNDTEFQDYILGYNEIDEIKYIYLNGLLGFYRLAGPSIRDLTVDGLPGNIDPFEVLDEVGSSITKVCFQSCEDDDIFRYLSQSNQSKYVQELQVIDSDFGPVLPIKNMTALTTFDISYFHMSHRPVCLTDCLTACPPSLKNLSLECRYLVTTPFKTKLESIETLKIDVPKITNDLTDVISTCFPNLVELSLHGRITENVNLTLDIPRFQKVTFSTRPRVAHEKCIHGFSFKSPAQTKPHNYIRNRNKEFGTPRANVRIKRKVIKDLPLLSVEFLTEAKPEFKGFDIVVVPC